ncbi:MAG: ATP-binding protein [Bacteroidales bacterium]|nr:ATP-binding protein [Bacteroidales bacterium]
MQTLAHHLLDVMVNSLEAGATEIDVTIRESIEKNVFRFLVEDDGCGMDKKLVKMAAEKGITTKVGKDRGWGLYLLKTMTEECEGTFQLSSHAGKSTRMEWTVKHDSDKRKPLGDISGVIADFIYAHKDIDVRFTYATEEATFSFFLPAMSYMYDLEKFESSSDLKRLKRVLEKNLVRINYNKAV